MNNIFAIITLSLISVVAFGHGEEKPGPHGGIIRMPGAFHTEVVPVKKNELKVYLLDINWKNPSVQNSTLEVSIDGKNPKKATCEIKENQYYLCSFAKDVLLNKKSEKLIVKATREGQGGGDAIYDLPLKQSISHGHHGEHSLGN